MKITIHAVFVDGEWQYDPAVPGCIEYGKGMTAAAQEAIGEVCDRFLSDLDAHVGNPTVDAGEQPTHTHNCKHCVFLGSYEWKGQDYDLYHCSASSARYAIVARFGDDSHEYICGEGSLDYPNDPLAVGQVRARERGLTPD